MLSPLELLSHKWCLGPEHKPSETETEVGLKLLTEDAYGEGGSNEDSQVAGTRAGRSCNIFEELGVFSRPLGRRDAVQCCGS